MARAVAGEVVHRCDGIMFVSDDQKWRTALGTFTSLKQPVCCRITHSTRARELPHAPDHSEIGFGSPCGGSPCALSNESSDPLSTSDPVNDEPTPKHANGPAGNDLGSAVRFNHGPQPSPMDCSAAGILFAIHDAVQQTLLEAWRCWDNFRGDQEHARQAWLRQILAHQLAHLARHYGATQKRDGSKEQSIDQTLARSAHRLEHLLANDQSTPSVVAAKREQQLRLADALEQLPEDYRQVIILRNIEDLSHEEVASRMQRTPGALRMLWLRALAALREQLTDA